MTTTQARVIVGIDGSEQALSAVRAAAREASHRNQPLHIVHAFIWPSLHVNVGPLAGKLPETGLRHHAEDLLEEATTEARKVAPQVPITTVLIDGSATPVLLEESRRATLLVLGDRGLGGVSGLIIGSVAVHTAAHAHCPVLVVRGAEPAVGPVVVGVDGSQTSTLAVGFAFQEADYRRAELVPVLTVGSGQWRASQDTADLVEQEARRTLSESLAGWRAQYPDVVVRPEVTRGHPRHVLVERSTKAQLVVLGAVGRDTFKGLVLGSVSQALLHHSACPVAVVRATLSPPPIDPLGGEPRSSLSDPLDNVDRFVDRPINAVSGLVPNQDRAHQVLEALHASGADVSDVVLLHGAEGVRILDKKGTNHGLHARFVRLFQNWGYDEAVLNLYDEGLRKGESVVVIPSTQDNKAAYARLLLQHQGHAIHYFGVTAAESLSGP